MSALATTLGDAVERNVPKVGEVDATGRHQTGVNDVFMDDSTSTSALSTKKMQLMNNILQLQDTLIDISVKVERAEKEHASLKEETSMMKQYLENVKWKVGIAGKVSSV